LPNAGLTPGELKRIAVSPGLHYRQLRGWGKGGAIANQADFQGWNLEKIS
jgi:hypothetical protein